MRLPTTITIALVLLLLPGVSAAEPQALLYDGWATDSGTSLWGEFHVASARGGDSSAVPGLAIEAESLLFEIDRSWVNVTTPANDPESETVQTTMRSVRINAVGGADHLLFIRGLDARFAAVDNGVFPASAAFDNATSASKSVTPAQARDSPAVDVTDSSRIWLGSEAVQFTGSFQVALYGWRGSIDVGGGREAFWTGERYEPIHPLASGLPYGGRTEWQEAFITVHNGSLTLDLSTALDEMYAAPAELVVSKSLLVHNARPTVGLPGKDEVYEGESTVRFTSGDTPTLTRHPSGAGSRIAAPQSSPNAPLTKFLWSLVALPLIPMVTATTQSVRNRRLMKQLRDGLRLGVVEFVTENAPKLRTSRWFGAEATALEVTALIRQGDLPAAEQRLQSMADHQRPPQSVIDYLWACTRAGQNRMDEARAMLASSIQLDPHIAPEARLNPQLAEFLSDDDSLEGYA